MTLVKRGTFYHYDFWYRNKRYRGSTEQADRDDAAQVESDLKTKLRQEARGIVRFDPNDSPLIADFVEVHIKAKAKKLKRVDLLLRTLRMCMAFWGAKPRKKPVEGGLYHDLRLADPLRDPSWLEQFEAWMDARGIEGSTKNSYISAMSQLYQTALRPRYRAKTGVDRNPFADVERNQTNVRVVDATVADLHAWINAASPHLRLALIIGGLAHKLRMEQVLALRFDKHIDRDLSHIRFAEFKTQTLKRSKPDQVTVISKDLRIVLEAVKKARPGVQHVITFRGKPVVSIDTAAAGAAKRAGLKYGMVDGGLTFHALRKIANTELARAGVPELLLAAAAGHKDPQTTRKHYTQMPTKDEAAVVELLSERLQLRQLAEQAVGTFAGTRTKRSKKSRGKRRHRAKVIEVPKSA